MVNWYSTQVTIFHALSMDVCICRLFSIPSNNFHLGVTRVSQKVCPFPSKKCFLRRLHLAKFIATSLHRNNDLGESVFQLFGVFPDNPWVDWLTKRATARVTPAFACPETSANRFSNTSMRRKRNLSFPKRTLWSKGKHQRWNKRPSYSLKRQVFFSFYSQHCCPRFDDFRVVFHEVLTRRLTGYSFRVLFSNLIQFSFTYDDIWLSETVRQTKTLQRCHTYIPGRTSVPLGRKNVPKVTMLLVIHHSYRFFS